ncbi:hypothetical protein BDP27DRAFT_1428541 [Rhodocollybia butyracea]|uniref:Uncharacterized protein n=1 Tax=Rhodocollybia butyracea TaxID=206335 RepID=A0A9P5PGU0_9AGAR|nr:hypothetical protein BDP27DRAFT_1428541 [Rhodocollybia butyracea]
MFLEFIGSSHILDFNEELLDQYLESLHTKDLSTASRSIFFVTSLESGLLLLLALGAALAMNGTMSQLGLADIIPQSEPGIESMCAFTQVAAISSTLILVRIGLGVDAQPSEKRRTGTDNHSTELLVPDLEQANINVEDTNPAIIRPFSLKHDDLHLGSATTIRPFLLKYRVPSLPEPGRIIGRLIRPFSLKYSGDQAPSGIADVQTDPDDHTQSDLPVIRVSTKL